MKKIKLFKKKNGLEIKKSKKPINKKSKNKKVKNTSKKKSKPINKSNKKTITLKKNNIDTKKITASLNSYNLERQVKEKEIFNEATKALEKENINSLNSIVLAGENWHHRCNWNSCFKINRKIL